MKITMVKKILADGSPCAKCGDVQERLDASGHSHRIHSIVIADERDENSEGMRLAAQHRVDHAPFFIVEQAEQKPRIYTVYLKFLKEVLDQNTDETEELKEIVANQDLDFL